MFIYLRKHALKNTKKIDNEYKFNKRKNTLK